MVFDRKTNTYYEEENSKFLLFLYNHAFGRCILKLLTRKFVSVLGGTYMNSRLSKHRIRKFIRKNQIDMNEYEETNYYSFNDFFTRKIKKEKRLLSNNKDAFLSPADSKLTVYSIDKDTCFWIKNSCYTVSDLLRDEVLARQYDGGYCFVFRLGVTDYHRYSYIDDGKVTFSKKIKGLFHTVQPIAFKKYRVFHENTREYQVLVTSNFKTIVQMEVGALMVGRICNKECSCFIRGEEKGYFCFGGSTIILLVQKDTVVVDQDILENSSKDIETRVQLFETIGRKKK